MYDVGKLELEAVRRVLASGQYFRYGGKETALFEREWAGRLGVPSVIGVTSGTAALITALKAMGIGPGDSVLVPGYTFISTALAVTAVGAVPIYVDIDDSLTMCPEDVAQKIRRHTACMIPVHMQGMPCDMAPLLRLARKRGVRVLEDCCQAAGGGLSRETAGRLGGHVGVQFQPVQDHLLRGGRGLRDVGSRPGGARLHGPGWQLQRVARDRPHEWGILLRREFQDERTERGGPPETGRAP